MRLGLQRRHLLRVTTAGALLGAVLLVAGLIGGVLEGAPVTRADVAVLVGSALLISAILPVFVALASIFQFETTDTHVHQTLWGHWQVSTKPLGDLTCIRTGRMFPLTLEFRDGTRLRVVAAPLGEVPPFVAHLQSHAPHARLQTFDEA